MGLRVVHQLGHILTSTGGPNSWCRQGQKPEALYDSESPLDTSNIAHDDGDEELKAMAVQS
jgi:hypothetical protein